MLGAVSADQHHSQGQISTVDGCNPTAEQASMGYQTQGTFGSSASSEDSDGPSHSPGHHPTPGPGQQEGHMQFACHACKISKVKCDKRHPCARCQRLDLNCVAQNRSRGRPLKLGGGKHAPYPKLHKAKSAPPRLHLPDRYDKGLPDPGPCNGSTNGSNGPWGSGGPVAAPPPPLPRGSMPPPVTKMEEVASPMGEGPHPSSGGGAMPSEGRAMMMYDPPPVPGEGKYDTVASAYLQQFTVMLNQGRLDHKRALCIIKTWVMYHHKHSVDLTRGVSDSMLSHLAPYASTNLHGAAQDPNYDDSEHLCDPTGNYFDVRLLPSYISQLDDGISPFCGYIYSGGDFHVFSNAKFADDFMDAEEVKMHMMTARVLPCFVWASYVVHSEDVWHVVAALTDTFFSEPARGKEMVHICKCRDRNGLVFLGLLRARWIILSDGSYSSLAFNIIRLPPSSPYLHLRLPHAPKPPIAPTARAPPQPRRPRTMPPPFSTSSPSPSPSPSTSSSSSLPPLPSRPSIMPPPPPPSAISSNGQSSGNYGPSPRAVHVASFSEWQSKTGGAPPSQPPTHLQAALSQYGHPNGSTDPDEPPPPPSLTGWDSLDQIAGLEQQGVHEDDHAGDPVETYYALCNMVRETWPGGGSGPPPSERHAMERHQAERLASERQERGMAERAMQERALQERAMQERAMQERHHTHHPMVPPQQR